MEQLAELEAIRAGVIRDTKETAAKFSTASTCTPEGSGVVVLIWRGIRYIVRPECVDPLTFHLYFALMVALDMHRALKVRMDDRHLRFMLAIGSILRCGDAHNQCTSECKTYGV